MRHFFGLIFWLLICYFMQPLTVYASPQANANFFALSDIHFNPFFSCQGKTIPCPVIQKLSAANYKQWPAILQHADGQTMSLYYQDSNFGLVKSTLDEVSKAAIQHHPRFAIITGDFQSHGFLENYRHFSGDTSLTHYHEFVKKFFEFLSFELRQALPGIPIYAALGNNDGYQDYFASPANSFFKDLLPSWSLLLATSNTHWRKDFAYGGYYSIKLPHQRLIVLNTSFFSSKGEGKNIKLGAKTEMNWLARQLQEAHLHHEKVWMIMHIPPGVDAYKTSQTPFGYISQFWHPDYSKAVLAEISKYADEITGIFAGHTHADAFEVIKTASTPVFISITPAISPLFGNNSGFKVYSYNPNSAEIKNFQVYYLPHILNSKEIAHWQLEYDFNQTYQPHCSTCALIDGMLNMPKSGKLAEAYQQYYTVNNPTAQPIHAGKWLPYYWCAIYNITKEDYKNCLKN